MDGQIIVRLRDSFFEDNPDIANAKTLGSTNPDRYLKNRIERAFVSGCNAAEEKKNKKALEALLALAFMTDLENIMDDSVILEDLRKAAEDWNIDIDKLLKSKR